MSIQVSKLPQLSGHWGLIQWELAWLHTSQCCVDANSVTIQTHPHWACSSLTVPYSSHVEAGFLDDRVYDSTALGPGYDRPFQFDPKVRESKSIQLYKHLNLKSCVWTFDAYYDMTELIDVCGGSVTADFQVGIQALAYRLQARGCHVHSFPERFMEFFVTSDS